MNTLISYKLAVLLKEKGCNLLTQYAYCERGGWNIYKRIHEPIHYILRTDGNPFGEYYIGRNWNSCPTDTKNKIRCSAPYIADVVMWLYEKYGIWIAVNPFYIKQGLRFSADIWKNNYKESINHYNQPTQAYEAAIEYCLTKLI